MVDLLNRLLELWRPAEASAKEPVRQTIDGTPDADELFGTSADDTLSSFDGDDTLAGGDGADLLDGGGGVDTASYADATGGVLVRLWNGTGRRNIAEGDTLIDIENLEGSSFNDLLIGSADDNALYGGAGNDYLSGSDGNDWLVGGLGADIIAGGNGFDTVSYEGSASAVNIDLATQTALGGDAMGDVLNGIENLAGSDFNDAIEGDSADNSLWGFSGDDTISGADGTDILYGGHGADTLDGGGGIDAADYSDSSSGVLVRLWNGTGLRGDAEGDALASIEDLFGSDFNDLLIGSDDPNTLIGHRGNDYLAGVGGVDVLYGMEGDDILDGGTGDDVVSGGTGNDVMTGGAGSDVFEISAGDGGDNTITDFSQLDGDIIVFENTYGISDLAGLIALLSGTGDGDDAVFTFTDGSTFTLEGVDADQLTVGDIYFAPQIEAASQKSKDVFSEYDDSWHEEFALAEDVFDFDFLI